MLTRALAGWVLMVWLGVNGCGRVGFGIHDGGGIDARDDGAVSDDVPALDAPSADAPTLDGGDALLDAPDAAAPPVCGDGLRNHGEQCDDANTTMGDGCEACMVQPGFLCVGAPSTCSITCGDGVHARSAEACDDGNTGAGDGCDPFCAIEPGYGCVPGRAEFAERRGRSDCTEGSAAPLPLLAMTSLGGATARIRYQGGAYRRDLAGRWWTGGVASVRTRLGAELATGPVPLRFTPPTDAEVASFDAAQSAAFALGPNDLTDLRGEGVAIATHDPGGCADNDDATVFYRIDALSRCEPVDGSLVAWFPFDYSFDNAIPGGADAMVTGGFAFRVGQIGAAMSPAFPPDGASVSTVDLGTSVPGDFTVSLWLGHRAWPAAVPTGADLLRGARFVLGAIVDGSSYSFGLRGDPGPGLATSPAGTDFLRHVAVTYDAGAGLAALYVDGAPIADIPGDLSMGPTLTLLSDGWFDELRVYSRSLAPAEIAALAVR